MKWFLTLVLAIAASGGLAANAQGAAPKTSIYETPPTQSAAKEMFVALEAFADAFAKTNGNCPGRFDAAKQSVIDAMNAAPERSAMPMIRSPSGADMGAFFDTVADALAETKQMPARRVMWLWIDALGRAVDDQSGFLFTDLPVSGPATPQISLIARAEGVFVNSVAAGSPAELAGLQTGDRITSIDGVNTTLMHISDIEALLAGPDESIVQVGAAREARNLSIFIIRTIQDSHLYARIQANIGVITMRRFHENTAAIISAAVDKIKQEKPSVSGYVLDLRENSGGGLHAVALAADMLLNEGRIVSTGPARGCGLEGKRPETHYSAKPGDVTGGAPIIVLIGPGTASGAEAFVAALVENNRARSVGSRTAGEGRVQTIVPLKAWQGANLRLTTSEMKTPSGQHFDQVGLSPTIELNADEDALAKAIALLQE